jgi:hypothetical protein
MNLVRKNTPGVYAGVKLDPKPIADYENKRYKETAPTGEYYFPTGAHNLEDRILTDVTDSDYLYLIPRVYSDSQYLGNLATYSYKMGLKAGNMKEVNSTEAASFEVLVESWIRMLLNLGPQQWILDYMDNPPRSDTITAIGDGQTGNTNVAVFEEDARNTLLGELESLSECMPNCVLTIWNDVFNHVYKLKSEWIKGAANLPGMYLFPMMPYEALTTLQTLKETIYSNSGLGRNHMQKFGIKFQKFSRDMLHPKLHVITGDWDPYVLGFLSEWILPYEGDGAPAGDIDIAPPYYAGIDGLENHRFFFKTGAKGGPNSVPLYKYLAFISPYSIDYNKYGGLIKSLYSTTDEDCFMKAGKYEASEFLASGLGSVSALLVASMFRCAWNNQNGSDNFRLSLTGDYQDADVDISVWLGDITQDLKFWKGLDEAKLHGQNERLMADILFK